MPDSFIQNIASYLPEKILSNEDLTKLVETSDEWIVSRTGIKERRIAAEDEYSSTMGAKAAKKLLDKTNIDPKDLELIIVATMTPDYLCPSTAALIQNEIGAPQAAAFDISAACSGFIYGLSTAKAFVESGQYSKVLLIATEKNSAFTDYSNRNTCILFGDGASACLITDKGPGLQICTSNLWASGQEADLLTIPAGGCRLPHSQTSTEHTIHMNGKEVFKHAVRRMAEAMNSCLQAAGLSIEEIAWLVPHQANIRIIDAIAKRFDLPAEKVAITIDRFANTSASTIPIALDMLLTQNSIHNNDALLLTALGGGLTWGATLLKARM